MIMCFYFTPLLWFNTLLSFSVEQPDISGVETFACGIIRLMFSWFHVALILWRIITFLFIRYTDVVFFFMMYLCDFYSFGLVLVVWRVSIRAETGLGAGVGYGLCLPL